MSVERMIAQMEKAIGWGEPNPIHSWYAARNGSYFGHGSTPWCNMAITWAAHHSGNYAAVCMGTDYAYTVWHAQAFQRAGRWHYGTAGIRRGDIVFFDWSGTDSIGAIDHVGIVTGVSGSAVYTIEGNIGNRCARFTRYANTIAGYGRPDYSKSDNIGNGADEVPDFNWYSADGGQTLNPGEWTTIVFNDKKGSKDGGEFWSVAFGETIYSLTAFVTLDGADLPEGTEVQMRAAHYRETGGIDLPGGILKMGASGSAVTKLQKALKKLGYDIGSYGADGDYGPDTRDAVKNVQRDARILVDGEYGPNTRKAMESMAGPKRFVKAKSQPISTTVHAGGHCHAGYALEEVCPDGHRVRVRVVQYGDKPVKVRAAKATLTEWKR